MKITLEKLKELKVCEGSIDYFKNKNYLNNEVELDILIEDLIKDRKYSYLQWLFPHCTEEQRDKIFNLLIKNKEFGWLRYIHKDCSEEQREIITKLIDKN
jgi:hypothetical protein